MHACACMSIDRRNNGEFGFFEKSSYICSRKRDEDIFISSHGFYLKTIIDPSKKENLEN